MIWWKNKNLIKNRRQTLKHGDQHWRNSTKDWLLATQWRIQAVWETSIPVWMPKKHFSSFLFLVVFQQECVDVAIIHFTMHYFQWQSCFELEVWIFSKWLSSYLSKYMRTQMSQELFVTKCYVNWITENLKKRENLLSVSKSFRFTIKNSELNAKKKYQTHKKK